MSMPYQFKTLVLILSKSLFKGSVHYIIDIFNNSLGCFFYNRFIISNFAKTI